MCPVRIIRALSDHPVERALRESAWFRPGDVVLAAVSGGADSMALFDALCGLASERGSLRVAAAHFDHGLREGSEADFDTVAAHADARGVIAHRGRGDVAALARRLAVSLEAAARAARYEFLMASAARESASWIATAHTRSDQVETVLMRILRGAGTRGLVGIAARRGTIVRPLLGVTGADTRDYCARYEVPFVHDPSNDDRRFARNAVRHDALPALRRAFPGIDDALVRLAGSAARELDAIRRETAPRLAAHLERESSDVWSLRARALEGLDADAAIVLFGDALEHMNRREDVSSAHYAALISLRVGASVDLPGVRVRREHDALVFRLRAGESPEDVGALVRVIEVPGEVRAGDWTLRAEPLSGAAARAGLASVPNRSPSGEAEYVAFVAAAPGDSLRLRAAGPGDRVRPFGMSGHKKLSDVFVDAKVPFRRRATSVVVEVNGEIAWVPGVVTGECARVGESTPFAVRLSATRDAGECTSGWHRVGAPAGEAPRGGEMTGPAEP